jgi:glycosyltransferase involved in cell wall biosynthesis
VRLLQITAGAAGMYCGSCLRDNGLAAALRARGHDVLLQPLYTPTRPDEANVSAPRVLFGGVSVYLEQRYPIFRRTPALLDRIWDSASVLRLASKRQIKIDPADLGEMTVSVLRGRAGYQRKEIDKMVGWLAREPRFDLIDLPNALLISLAGPLRDALGIPVVCTMQGEDLFLDGLREPYRSEALGLIRAAMGDVDLFVAVSDYYAEFMSGYLGIPRDKVRVVPLGIRVDGYTPKPASTTPPYTIGYFARIAPEKGLQCLADAYRRLRAMPGAPETRLVAGGWLREENRDYLDRVRRELAAAGLAGEFTYAGAPDREGKIALLQSMDVMSVPSPYAEPKGIFVLEAMAAGIPVVQPRRGTFTEMIEKTGGGVLVPPDDPDALAHALFELLTDRRRADALGKAAADGVRRHYHVDRMADVAERVYGEAIAGSGRSARPAATR